MKKETMYVVCGLHNLEGMVFARCTTLEKAQKVKALLGVEGFEDMTDIVQVEFLIDAVKIGGEIIEL